MTHLRELILSRRGLGDQQQPLVLVLLLSLKTPTLSSLSKVLGDAVVGPSDDTEAGQGYPGDLYKVDMQSAAAKPGLS